MLNITISYSAFDEIEMFLYQDGEKMTLYPKDDDHAEILIDGFQRGCYNKCIITDHR